MQFVSKYVPKKKSFMFHVAYVRIVETKKFLIRTQKTWDMQKSGTEERVPNIAYSINIY